MGEKSFNEQVIDEFRANGGKVGGPFEGAPMLLLTTTGAKSGRQITQPLVYSRDGDNVVIIASNGGAPTNPNWYHNIVANPKVTVEIGEQSFDSTATVTEGAKRDRLFAAHADLMPGFWDYQKQTDRVIPAVVLQLRSTV